MYPKCTIVLRIYFTKRKNFYKHHRDIFIIFFWEFHMLKKIFIGWLKTDLLQEKQVVSLEQLRFRSGRAIKVASVTFNLWFTSPPTQFMVFPVSQEAAKCTAIRHCTSLATYVWDFKVLKFHRIVEFFGLDRTFKGPFRDQSPFNLT